MATVLQPERLLLSDLRLTILSGRRARCPHGFSTRVRQRHRLAASNPGQSLLLDIRSHAGTQCPGASGPTPHPLCPHFLVSRPCSRPRLGPSLPVCKRTVLGDPRSLPVPAVPAVPAVPPPACGPFPCATLLLSGRSLCTHVSGDVCAATPVCGTFPRVCVCVRAHTGTRPCVSPSSLTSPRQGPCASCFPCNHCTAHFMEAR